MTATAQSFQSTGAERASAQLPRTLGELRRLSASQAEALYFEAATPRPDALAGDYAGYLLGARVVGLGEAFSIQRINQRALPWKGKFFADSDAQRGAGGNRVALGRLRTTIWPFATHVAPSRFGSGNALHIDYDLPRNPVWLRRGVFDELRQLAPDLFVGLGGLHVAGEDRFIFSWAVCPVGSPAAS
jgi:hypothetical protein